MIEKVNYSDIIHTLTESLNEVIDVVNSGDIRNIDEQLKETEMRIQNKLDDYGVSISQYLADPTGVLDSYNAFLSAITSYDEIYIPKGVYLIGQNLTIPANKKFVFGRNARLKPANSVTITILGTWDASDDDWIFEMSLGGVIGGDFKIAEVHPEWFGAKGDGISDDAKAFNDAMTVCAKKRIIRLGAKTYKIKSTIESNCRGIKGAGAYVDGQNGGTLLSFDPTDIATDLLPCIRIETAGHGAIFEGFRIAGKVGYASRYLSDHIDKDKFEVGTYDMFTTGVSALEVAGAATPVFRNMQTVGVKVGLFLNSTNGHVTSYDSTWSGLIGVYCKRNSEDYFFQGGSITGAFCGFMLGIFLQANHYGGAALTMKRVHMGYSPYGFYQVKDTPDYDSIVNCGGIYGAFESVRFERIGEACVKLLPKSEASGYFSGIGMSWSPVDYPPDVVGGWVCPIPDDLILPQNKQKYALYFGKVSRKLIIDNWDAGGAYKSPNSTGAIGTAYFDHIATDDIMLDGLGDPSLITVRRKRESLSIVLTTPKAVEYSIHSKVNNPISHGQLVRNPEVVSNWTVGIGATLSIITDLTQLPARLSHEACSFLGENIKILKITPDGISSPNLSLPVLSPAIVDTGREICYEYFIMSEVAVSVRSSLAFGSNTRLYDTSYRLNALKWERIRGRGLKPPNNTFINMNIGNLDKTASTYIVGLMVSYDNNGAYSPHPHAYTSTDLEIGGNNGLILTDTVDGTRSKITLTNGSLQPENMNVKTKVYSPNGVPYKITVADDGTLTTSLDALVYDSFDRVDSATSLGSVWTTPTNGWGISSNEAYPIIISTSATRAGAIWAGGVGTTNYNVGCTMKGQLTDATNYSRCGLYVKYVDANNQIYVTFTNNAIQIYRRLISVDTIVASVAFKPSDNVYYKMRVAVKNNNISVYVDGDLKVNYKLTLAEITVFGLSQLVGLRHIGGGTVTVPTARFNNFVVEQI
jgi:hypothetical protein